MNTDTSATHTATRRSPPLRVRPVWSAPRASSFPISAPLVAILCFRDRAGARPLERPGAAVTKRVKSTTLRTRSGTVCPLIGTRSGDAGVNRRSGARGLAIAGDLVERPVLLAGVDPVLE